MIWSTIRAVFRPFLWLIRAVVTPWYLRWIFRLPWFGYALIGLIVGGLAVSEYNRWQTDRAVAEIRILEGPPPAIPLSDLLSQPVRSGQEVQVAGLYFPSLPTGSFDFVGLDYAFVPLADESGREISAVLVTRSNGLGALQRRLRQGQSGATIPVVVNGQIETVTTWETEIRAGFIQMGLPPTTNFIMIEPFLTDRATALRDHGNRNEGFVIVLAVLTGIFLAISAFARARSRSRQPRTAARPTPPAATPPPTPVATLPPQNAPWGGPPPRVSAPARSETPPPAAPPTDTFASVFPGGGSGFRFKTADEIIRETFGRVSTLSPSAPPKDRSD